MSFSLVNLGDMVRAHREQRLLTQEQLSQQTSPPTNRSVIAHLEQGRRIPEPDVLSKICSELQIPQQYWQPFTEEGAGQVFEFEEYLGELVGRHVELSQVSSNITTVARAAIARLLGSALTDSQSFDLFNSVLIYYDVRPPLSLEFFHRYLRAESFKSVGAFGVAVRNYQREAIRIFNSFSTAYETLNSSTSMTESLQALNHRDDAAYRNRISWDVVEIISDERLPNLGYIAANLIKQEQAERQALSSFLKDLSVAISENGVAAVADVNEKKRRKMDGLLRKFNSTIQHGFLSPLFVSDADLLKREAESLAPKDDRDLSEMAETQQTGLRNLARYLAADHLDVYVATSMRLDSDFVSVNSFVSKLFVHEEILPLKLRYFNPTQSWIEDRVAKGLVEALMLKRADYTIYMAQKEDSFGKDSEASVALGQGKPVIVFVPKLHVPDASIDSEEMSKLGREQLIAAVSREGTVDDKDIDETMDIRGLMGRLLEIRLHKLSNDQIVRVARDHWADFGLYAEAQRISNDNLRAEFRNWLDVIIHEKQSAVLSDSLKEPFIRMMVATAMRFEDRSTIFRETHPLALQVILSSGVLNGMIVVRSVNSCARILKGLIKNDLSLELQVDAHNYRLIETSTNSIIRVISRHRLIESAFSTFYQD